MLRKRGILKHSLQNEFSKPLTMEMVRSVLAYKCDRIMKKPIDIALRIVVRILRDP